MGIVFLLVSGSILGWLAAIIAQAEHRRGLVQNISAGVIGALLGGLLVCPMIGGGDLVSGSYDVAALLAGLAGSVGLLLAVNLLRRDIAR